MTLRTVAGDTSRSWRERSVWLATGSPVWMCSWTMARRISRSRRFSSCSGDGHAGALRARRGGAAPAWASDGTRPARSSRQRARRERPIAGRLGGEGLEVDPLLGGAEDEEAARRRRRRRGAAPRRRDGTPRRRRGRRRGAPAPRPARRARRRSRGPRPRWAWAAWRKPSSGVQVGQVHERRLLLPRRPADHHLVEQLPRRLGVPLEVVGDGQVVQRVHPLRVAAHHATRTRPRAAASWPDAELGGSRARRPGPAPRPPGSPPSGTDGSWPPQAATRASAGSRTSRAERGSDMGIGTLWGPGECSDAPCGDQHGRAVAYSRALPVLSTGPPWPRTRPSAPVARRRRRRLRRRRRGRPLRGARGPRRPAAARGGNRPAHPPRRGRGRGGGRPPRPRPGLLPRRRRAGRARRWSASPPTRSSPTTTSPPTAAWRWTGWRPWPGSTSPAPGCARWWSRPGRWPAARSRAPSWGATSSSSARASTVDRDALARRLVELGYARVPLVEDPGPSRCAGRWWTSGARSTSGRSGSSSSATRWRAPGPSSRARSARSPTWTSWWWSRRARRSSPSRARRRRVRAVRELAEKVDRPTSKVREVLDAIESGTPFFGMEALLPGFHDGRRWSRCSSTCRPGPALLVDDPERRGPGPRRAGRRARTGSTPRRCGATSWRFPPRPTSCRAAEVAGPRCARCRPCAATGSGWEPAEPHPLRPRRHRRHPRARSRRPTATRARSRRWCAGSRTGAAAA